MNKKVEIFSKAIKGDKAAFKLFYSHYLGKFYALCSSKNISLENKHILIKIFHISLTKVLINYKSGHIDKSKWSSKEFIDSYMDFTFKNELRSSFLKNVISQLNSWDELVSKDKNIDDWLNQELAFISHKKYTKGRPTPIQKEELNEIESISTFHKLFSNIQSPPGKSLGKIKLNVKSISRGTPSTI